VTAAAETASPAAARVEGAGPPRGAAIRAVPARYPGRWVAGLVAVVLLVLVVRSFALSPNIDWAAVRSYLGYHTVLSGIRLTILLAVAAQAVGIVGGVVLAIMRLSANPVLSSISWLYIWFFRGTPVLIQIIFWFNISLVFPRVALSVPGTDIGFSASTNSLVTAMMAAVLALGLNEAAYMAEIVRGGIVSVDQGQSEAAASIGLTRAKAMRLVILPQAVRAIIPPTGSEFIGMLKATSLVSVIAARELMTATDQISAQNFLTIELLLVASFWYLLMTSVTTVLQSLVERRFESSLRTRPQTLTRRLWDRMRTSVGDATGKDR
jgi:polar amino acid transport system permease protein